MTDYFTDSMCWSAVGFLTGYLLAKLEVAWRQRHDDS